MKKQRVIFFSPVSYSKGGAERSLMDLVKNPSVEPILITPSDGEILELGKTLNIECHVLDFGDVAKIRRPFSFLKGMCVFKSLIISANNLKKLAKKSDCNIVHSNGLKAHFINCTSRCLGGAKAVIHIRDIPYTKSETLIWHILHLMCNKMVLVSRACWPGHNLPKKAVVIHNGTPLINGLHKQRSFSPDSAITLGFVGRIHPAKGLHLLLDWIAKARASGLNVRLSVRGAFSEDAPNYKNEINEQIKLLSLSQNVELLGHISDPKEVYIGLDVVAVPSKTPDPLPRAVMESMAHGIPVLGYPAGGIFEMIEDGNTGFLVRDGEGFCRAIKKLLTDSDALNEMTRKAKVKIQSEFTLEILYKEIGSIYRTI